jgi:hypothetical protein
MEIRRAVKAVFNAKTQRRREMSKDLVCLKCTLPICDELSTGCLYTAGRDVKKKARVAASRERFKLKGAIAALGFKKYDRRFKPGSDPVQRLIWREQKRARKNGRELENRVDAPHV